MTAVISFLFITMIVKLQIYSYTGLTDLSTDWLSDWLTDTFRQA